MENIDYYPFGGLRLDSKTTSFNEKKKYTGHEYDEATNLTYMGARYYPGSIGRFLSQDPAYLAVGTDYQLKQKTGLELRKYLENPQNLNSYSYTINNPLKHVDQKGEWFDIVVDAGFIAYDLYKLGHVVFTGGDFKGEAQSLGLDIGSAAIPGVVGLGAAARVIRTAENAADAGKMVSKVSEGLSKYSVQKPNISDQKLKNIINDLYRPGAKIGNGSTADAIRYELKTGEQVGGKSHIQKGQDYTNALNKWIKNNPNSEDLNSAKRVLNDLNKSLKGK